MTPAPHYRDVCYDCGAAATPSLERCPECKTPLPALHCNEHHRTPDDPTPRKHGLWVEVGVNNHGVRKIVSKQYYAHGVPVGLWHYYRDPHTLKQTLNFESHPGLIEVISYRHTRGTLYHEACEDLVIDEHYLARRDATLHYIKEWERDGFYRAYYWDGSRKLIGSYVDGKRDGHYEEYHEDGALLTRATYSQGQLHGTYEAWHTDGTHKVEGHFALGKRAGSWRYHYPDGGLFCESQFEQGERTSITFHPNDNPTLANVLNAPSALALEARAFTAKNERDAVLQTRRQLEHLGSLYYSRQYSDDIASDIEAAVKALQEHYHQCLPIWTLAICPFCDAPYQHSIDPFGFDGPWWVTGTNTVRSNCSHAKLIRSAHLGTAMMEPRYEKESIRLGPQAPYVIPYLLDMTSMVAVVSEHPFPAGDTLFAMVYFSKETPSTFDLGAPWDQDALYTYRDYNAWDDPKMCWDFDLMRWVREGSLRWCVRTDDTLHLAPLDGAPFPFATRLGHPGRQVAHGSKVQPQGSVQPGLVLYTGDYSPTKHALSRFLEDTLPRHEDGTFIKPHHSVSVRGSKPGP